MLKKAAALQFVAPMLFLHTHTVPIHKIAYFPVKMRKVRNPAVIEIVIHYVSR